MKNYVFFILIIFGFTSCFSGIKQEDLIGKWQYTKYEYTNKSVEAPPIDLKEQQPYIVFYKDGKAEIYASGKLLSHGTYSLDGKIIRYEEVLENGIKRKIPFLIKELNPNQLVFETMEAEVKRITAQKSP
jgi:hypothetical protein